MKYTRICAIPPNFLILLPIKPPRDTAVHSVDQESILAKTSLLLLYTFVVELPFLQELYTKHHDYHMYDTDILIQKNEQTSKYSHKMYIFVNQNKFMYLYIYNSPDEIENNQRIKREKNGRFEKN